MSHFVLTPDGGEFVELPADEAAELEAKAVAVAEAVEAENAALVQKAADAAAGNQKLLDLGLTQAEATALTGYIPPAE